TAPRRPRFPYGQQPFEPGQHAQPAVERPALRHRVDVRAGQHRGTLAPQHAEGVAGRVDARLEPGLLHLTEEPAARLLVGRAPAGASDPAAVGISTVGRQRLDVTLEAGQRDPGGHGRREYTAPRCLTLSDAGSYHGNTIFF